MATYLGAFPFPSQAPAILTFDALVRVIVLLAGRHGAVLKRGKAHWMREIYRSMAVYDRTASQGLTKSEEERVKAKGRTEANSGFAIDQPIDDEGDEEDDDELILAAFESMDVNEAFKHGEQANVHHSIIPTDNFLKLVQLMLLIAPLDQLDDLSVFFAQLTDERLEGLRKRSGDILASFGVESSPGVTYRTFDKVVSSTLPNLFDGLNALVSHFLFAKDLDLSKRKGSSTSHEEKLPPVLHQDAGPERGPVLPSPGDILDLDMLSQLSFFLKPGSLFRQIQPLYSGSNKGFSMGSFEKHVFNWRAPTILLVSGTLLSKNPTDPQSKNFLETLPPQRYESSVPAAKDDEEDQTLIYGAYITQPWKSTSKTPFGDSSTILFRLSPSHAVCQSSAKDSNYVYFNPSRTSSTLPGIGFGTAIPQRRPPHLSLGPVSLHLDDGLEFGVFTHIAHSGGSFEASPLLPDFQDRFFITDIEVWGCGGTEEAEAQKAAWKWEEAEAERRRRINLGTGDIEADKELLRMAGLIGGDRSGGSMG